MENLGYRIKEKSYDIDYIIKLINKEESHHIIDGTRVKTEGLRLKSFASKELKCVSCGRKADRFEIAANFTQDNWHLTLWSDNVQMTKDHIIPKSKGGANTLDNIQIMCTSCNNRKGNVLSKDDLKKGKFKPDSCNTPINKKNFLHLTDETKETQALVELKQRFPDIRQSTDRVRKFSRINNTNAFFIDQHHPLFLEALDLGILNDISMLLDYHFQLVRIMKIGVHHKEFRMIPLKVRRKILKEYKETK